MQANRFWRENRLNIQKDLHLRSTSVLWHCNDVVSIGQEVLLKKLFLVVRSASEITYRLSKTFENTYEGVRFSEVISNKNFKEVQTITALLG